MNVPIPDPKAAIPKGTRARRGIHGCAHFLIAILCMAPIHAQESFSEPEAYPVARYMAGWSRNPFALKTAPAMAPTASFANDLVLASMYQVSGETVVIVANTRTRERISLRNDQPAPNGMRVKAVFFEDLRKDSRAELVLGHETAVVRYQQHAFKQMAAHQATEKLVESLVSPPSRAASAGQGGDGGPGDPAPPPAALDLAATVSSVPSGRRARLVIPSP